MASYPYGQANIWLSFEDFSPGQLLDALTQPIYREWHSPGDPSWLFGVGEACSRSPFPAPPDAGCFPRGLGVLCQSHQKVGSWAKDTQVARPHRRGLEVTCPFSPEHLSGTALQQEQEKPAIVMEFVSNWLGSSL